MNLFKKALIDPSKLTSQPKTHSFTPVVADSQNFYQEFMNRIMQVAASMPGWGGYNVQNGYSYDNMQVSLSCVCPHGQSLEVALSTHAMMTAPTYGGGAAMADDAFARLVNVCQSQHANIPPPGNFIYSLAQANPIGYQTYNNYLTIEVFKEQYATEYQKQMEQQLVAYGYGGSGSILDELLSICPGLATIARACPDKCVEYGSEALPLSHLIQHINDRHEWSREKIAEWLDIIALDDPTVDLTIKPKEKQRAQPSIGPSSEEVAKLYGELTFDAGNISGELLKGILGGGT